MKENSMTIIAQNLLKSLPTPIAKRLIKSNTARKFMRLSFGIYNETTFLGGYISWEDLDFYFASHYSGFVKAQTKGIENRICRLAHYYLKDGDSAIDVGSNYGFVTNVMALSVKPQGRVIAFEIETTIAAKLSETISRNDLQSVVTIIPQGAGAPEETQFTTVDTHVEQLKLERVRFLKIDTDGSDFNALRGAGNTIAQFHPIIVIEMSQNGQAILEFLKKQGYSYFIDMSGETVEPGKWPENLIASVEPVSIPPRGFRTK